MEHVCIVFLVRISRILLGFYRRLEEDLLHYCTRLLSRRLFIQDSLKAVVALTFKVVLIKNMP